MTSQLEILFVDNHLLVVNKPAGLLTQPSGTEQESLEHLAKEWIKTTYQKPGNVFLHTVHRLDKPVSGVVVFARTSKALSRLNESIREKQAKKIYYALVEGKPLANEGTLEHYIIHDDFQAKIVSPNYPSAKLARLHYRVIKQQGPYTLLEVELETGRYHQIRLQLAAMDCPIIGDKKYGSSQLLDGNIALHHARLQLTHPVSGELLAFEAPLPSYFNHKA